MRKILLAIALMISVSAIAQTTWYSNYNKLSSWSTYYERWDKAGESSDVITILFSGMDVYVKSNEPTLYHCYGKSRPSTGMSDNNGAWTASDWWCYWWENGIKKTGELRVSNYQDGTSCLTIFFYNRSVYYALSYYSTN